MAYSDLMDKLVSTLSIVIPWNLCTQRSHAIGNGTYILVVTTYFPYVLPTQQVLKLVLFQSNILSEQLVVVTFGTCVLLSDQFTIAGVLSTLATFNILEDPLGNL